MTIPVVLVDRNGRSVIVNEVGEIRVADGDYDLTSFREMAADDTAYNFYTPRIGKQFVLTGLLCFADKDVNNASDTIIDIFEASTESTTTIDKTILEFGMGQLSVLPFPNVRILVNEGVYINGKTSDDDVHLNIIGHFINTINDSVE